VRVIPARIFDRVHGEFPNVVFVDSQGNGTNGRQPPDWQEDVLTYSLEEPGVGRALPRCVTEAAYLINQSLLKGHPTTGFTGCAKNHYGSVTIRDHKVYVNSSKHPMGIYHPFVDMIGSNALGGKTVLFMTDALYGIRDVNDVVGDNAKWAQLFEGQWMASLLLSQDPIAIDSVIFDFLSAEFPAGRGGTPAPLTNADNFLHEGARADDPPSGTFYRPNGARLASLGVHEHWNNPSARQYTRNLGTGPGIELFRVTAGDSRPAHARRFVCADYTQGKVFLIGPDGEPVWEREAPNSNDLAVLPNGNVLFTTGHGVRETTPDGVVVFRYDSDHEVYGCQRLPDGNTLVGDSTAGRLLEVDPHGTAVKSLSLLAPGEEGGHAYMRNARKLASGHYLVALFRDQRVREYDGAGKVVWEAPAPGGAHSVERLPDGHTLVTTGDRGQREPRLMELDAGGAVVWQVSNEDLPGRPLRFLCGFHRLANGNIVVANWLGHGQEGKAPLLLEISPKKEVVWSYARHDRLRTASSVFVLDAP
jgi:outer membrane protein assembly factor BamB